MSKLVIKIKLCWTWLTEANF